MWLRRGIAGLIALTATACDLRAEQPALKASPSRVSAGAPLVRSFVGKYCVDCHQGDEPAGRLTFDLGGSDDLRDDTDAWEKVVHKLRSRQMPPLDAPRPAETEYEGALSILVRELDELAEKQPNPGRTETFRRLTRTEYQNAVRDLFGLDIDVTELLPRDESSHGFDNVTVGDLSATRLDRYITAAQKISRLVVGSFGRGPACETIRIRPDVTQDEHVEGLPLGTRGGALVPFHFPQDGEYEVQVRLARDRNEEIEGLRDQHEVEFLLDRARIELLTVKPAKPDEVADNADAHLKTRVRVSAGPHQLGVTFLKNPSSLQEIRRQPLNVHFNMHRHPRIGPAVYQISITGPYSPTGPGETPSRGRIFVCDPTGPGENERCAERILSPVMRRAYRRPVSDADLAEPMKFFRSAREDGDFDAGIEAALASILVSPNFLFRIEQDPDGATPNQTYRISDLELASRLSFFLWSSVPDDELLDAAIQGTLRTPEILEQQVRRMLADSRSSSLVTNYAGQWLHLRNLDSITPDARLFPDFDDNLRQAFRRETELVFESMVREDRSVLDLISADDTYLNERLAKHYGIPYVFGSHFRRVTVDDETHRGGLLRQGSILFVTSYPTRTSPVIRGNWILENILGSPAPPPPANVPALKDQTVSASLSVRARLAEHRANAVCAGCHGLMDPVGFALENFDAVGRWRTEEDGEAIDASGGLPGGSQFAGVEGLERELLRQPEQFVGTLTEKLMAYALGRGIEPYDAPAIRKIVLQAREADFHFSSLIIGIVNSTPFQMRRSS